MKGSLRMSTRLVTVVAALLLSSGCATNTQVRAVQQTAVGGGFVAIGALGVASTAVAAGATLATTSSNPDALQSVALGALVAGAVSGGILAGGMVIMSLAEKDLLAIGEVSANRREPKQVVEHEQAPRRESSSRADSSDVGLQRRTLVDSAPRKTPTTTKRLRAVSERMSVGILAQKVLIHMTNGEFRGCENARIFSPAQEMIFLPSESVSDAFTSADTNSLPCADSSLTFEACGKSIRLSFEECLAVSRAAKETRIE